jgi:hypothetical protein
MLSDTKDMKYDVLTAVKMSMLVFWAATPCRCLHLQGRDLALKMEVVYFSETLVSTYKPTWCFYPEDQHRQA